MTEVEEHKLPQLASQVLNGTYLVNCRWDCWSRGVGGGGGVKKKPGEKWQSGIGDGVWEEIWLPCKSKSSGEGGRKERGGGLR